MIYDELGRRKWVDYRCFAAELDHRVAHGGKIDDSRYAGEVLQDYAGRRECDFLTRCGGWIPVGQRLDVVGRDVLAILVP